MDSWPAAAPRRFGRVAVRSGGLQAARLEFLAGLAEGGQALFQVIAEQRRAKQVIGGVSVLVAGARGFRAGAGGFCAVALRLAVGLAGFFTGVSGAPPPQSSRIPIPAANRRFMARSPPWISLRSTPPVGPRRTAIHDVAPM